MKPKVSPLDVVRHFLVRGEATCARPYGAGHINDTFLIECGESGAPHRYILQRINRGIFKSPEAVMENIGRVTSHLASKQFDSSDPAHRTLTVISTRPGRFWHVDADGEYWRMYGFIEGGRSFEAVDSPVRAFEAGKTVGRFQRLLVDLPAPRLHETIPGFHDTAGRFAAFEQAVQGDVLNRAKVAKYEIDFAMESKSLTAVLKRAELPERITHNDPKLNNILFDEATGRGLCLLDLDTVMPGLVVHDFGDLVRSASCPAAEDECDLDKVEMHFSIFEALAKGYLAEAGGFLTRAEKQLLAFAGRLITFETGLRFLTDFLTGDTYFKTHRERHNLDRCRVQFKLVRSIERQEGAMQKLIDTI